MGPWVKSRNGQLLLGLISGIIFGFLLQKGQVTKYGVIMGTFLFTDLTVVKVMFSAVVVGAIGIHYLRGKGRVEPRTKEAVLGRNIVGGIIFGMGFGLLGYCPGTGWGAVGQGSLDALFGGVLGMLVGAALFAESYGFLKRNVLGWGKVRWATLPQMMNKSPWTIIGGLTFFVLALFVFIESMGL
jgi:uncharacterized membrane protein YedE/YeeE